MKTDPLYGGFISDSKMKQHTMMECFDALINSSKENSFKTIRYKCIPHIYHKQPSEEDKFALFANRANLLTIDVSTVINLLSPLKMPKGRKAQISRAKREGVLVEELSDLKDFQTFISYFYVYLEKRIHLLLGEKRVEKYEQGCATLQPSYCYEILKYDTLGKNNKKLKLTVKQVMEMTKYILLSSV